MPAENLVLDAALTVNSYSITYTINGEEYTAQTYEDVYKRQEWSSSPK